MQMVVVQIEEQGYHIILVIFVHKGMLIYIYIYIYIYIKASIQILSVKIEINLPEV